MDLFMDTNDKKYMDTNEEKCMDTNEERVRFTNKSRSDPRRNKNITVFFISINAGLFRI